MQKWRLHCTVPHENGASTKRRHEGGKLCGLELKRRNGKTPFRRRLKERDTKSALPAQIALEPGTLGNGSSEVLHKDCCRRVEHGDGVGTRAVSRRHSNGKTTATLSSHTLLSQGHREPRVFHSQKREKAGAQQRREQRVCYVVLVAKMRDRTARFAVTRFTKLNLVFFIHICIKEKQQHLQVQPSSSIWSSQLQVSGLYHIADMDTASSQGLYPLHRCKTIHLVRHAQGFHNVAGEKDHSAYMSPELFDAHLTPLGWLQVDNLRKHVHSSGISKRIELVVVSPLLRTIQTAVGVFGGEAYADGIDAPPLMTANAGDSNHPAISSLNSPPFVAVELCREHLIETDADTLWKLDVREADKDLAQRGLRFLNWLWTREETEIAVVTHSGFLIHTLAAFGDDCHPSVKNEICRPFNNCELRSVVIVDKSMISSSASKTDYPGKIPRGPDAPSDSADEKH
ncbi:phosphoglycerate mutase family protein [Striga asiatica]|uniref:Phosphoglycerate mutase family protein n=1 Tax=Striga asiatica TaxID=4170 RepID=A0A5A7R9H7_STRAF|nr:phosphoglycerate mutase family protein [Striga asiatica]